jgi:hypothetical protein
VKPLERLVVHVEEAIRLGTASEEAKIRLGLMLIDSAAELLMFRETDHMIVEASVYQDWLQRAEQVYSATGRGQDYIDELRGKVFSKSKRNQIERDFNAKCDVLVKAGKLPEPYSRVLKKLHEYRNETTIATARPAA